MTSDERGQFGVCRTLKAACKCIAGDANATDVDNQGGGYLAMQCAVPGLYLSIGLFCKNCNSIVGRSNEGTVRN